MEKFKTEYEENLIKNLESQMNSVEFSAWIIGIKNDWISEEGKKVLFDRIKNDSLNSIEAMYSYFKQEKDRAFSTEEECAIEECYRNGLRPLVEKLDTIQDLQMFLEIRNLFLNTNVNKDFLFEVYKSEISPCFRAKRIEARNRIIREEPLTEEEIEYMDEIYSIDIVAYIINSNTIYKVKELYKRIEKDNPEKLKDCKFFKILFKSLVEFSEKMDEKSFLYCMNLCGTETIEDNLRESFMRVGKNVNVQFSKEIIKELVRDEEKRKFIEEFYKDNPDGLENFKDQINETLLDFLEEAEDEEFELTDEDKKFYEEYLNVYFKEFFEKNKYNEKGMKTFNKVRDTKFLEGEKGKYFKEKYRNHNVWSELDKEVTAQIEKLDKTKNVSIEELKKTDFIFKKANSLFLFLNKNQVKYLNLYIKQLENLDISQISRMNCIEDFMYVFSSKIYDLKKDDLEKNDALFESLCNYIELLMKKDENSIFKFDSIDILNQMVKEDRLPEKYKEKFKTILEKNIEKLNIETPNMEKYEDKVLNFKDMEKEEFSEFMENIKKIKVLEDVIPEKYCDYLIAQKINSQSYLNQGLYKYFHIFKAAFKDKTKYVLEQKGIKNYVVRILEDEYWDSESDWGRQNARNKTIDFSESKLYQADSNNASIVRTMFHEIHHAYQEKNIREDRFSKITYNILKEKIIREKNPNFYKANYILMQNEIDARIVSSVLQYNYLKKLGLSNQKIVNYDLLDINSCLTKLLKLEYERKDEAKEKNINGAKENVDIIFKDIIKENPKLVEENPILGIEFDLDGNRKSNITILKEYEKALLMKKEFLPLEFSDDKEKNNEYERLIKMAKQKDTYYLGIYIEIMKSDAEMSSEQVLNDILQINDYKPKHKAAKYYFNYIITEKILPEFKKWHEDGKINLSEKLENEEESFRRASAELYKYAIENPDEDSSKKILDILGQDFILPENVEVNALKKIDSRDYCGTKKKWFNGFRKK